MDFYFGQVSGNSARVAFALHEMGVPFRPRPIDMRAGESRLPGYLAVNPMGKIPALVDGAFQLWESNAINWYLAEMNPNAGFFPTTPAARASVQRWLLFQTGHVTPECFPIIRAHSARMQKAWNLSGTPEAAEAARKVLPRFLSVLEQALSGRPWLEGEFSLADIAYAPHLWLVDEAGFDFSTTPAVRAWLDRLLARPAWLEARLMIFGE